MSKYNYFEETKAFLTLSDYEKFVFLLFFDRENFIEQFMEAINYFDKSTKDYLNQDGTPIYLNLLDSDSETKEIVQQIFKLNSTNLEWFACKFGFSSYKILVECFKFLIKHNVFPFTKYTKDKIDIKKHNTYLKYIRSYLSLVRTEGSPEKDKEINDDTLNFILDPRNEGRVIEKMEPILKAYRFYQKIAAEIESNSL